MSPPRERESRPGGDRAAFSKIADLDADSKHRNRLARSVLAHATPPTAMVAIDPALLALQGASLEDLLELMDMAS